MLGQKIDYTIEVDGGKSKYGIIISFYTGLMVSISEYGSLVFNNGAEQKVIYTPKITTSVATIIKDVDEAAKWKIQQLIQDAEKFEQKVAEETKETVQTVEKEVTKKEQEVKNHTKKKRGRPPRKK
jgi:Fe2+ transport system protein B